MLSANSFARLRFDMLIIHPRPALGDIKKEIPKFYKLVVLIGITSNLSFPVIPRQRSLVGWKRRPKLFGHIAEPHMKIGSSRHVDFLDSDSDLESS